jgi:hypothetical protein
VGFEQAAIKVEKQKEFSQLRDAVLRVFSAQQVEKYLIRLQKKGIRIRDFDLVLASGVLESLDDPLSQSGKPARGWYQELTVSDQAQMREFYLSKIEEVEPTLRSQYQKLYRYY